MPNKISVSEIGEYIRNQSCQRRFKLSFNNREESRKLPFVDRLFNTIDPVLKDAGKKREDEWDRSLQHLGFRKFSFDEPELETHIDLFFNAIRNITGDVRVFGRELKITGLLNDFQISGRIDFLIIQLVNNVPLVKVVECKASRRDKTYHRIQVCLYKLLLRDYFINNQITVNGIRLHPDHLQCVVARIDESTNRTQNIMELQPLILDREEDDIMELVRNEGPFSRIIAANLDSLSFQLNLKCDDCVFNVHCLSESSRLRSLELLSTDATAVKIMKSQGVQNIDQLAELDLNAPAANAIRNNPSFSYSLDLLKKKAAARRKTLLHGDEHPDEFPVTSYGFSFGSQLPEYEISGERLVRVYLAVDYDYVENRVVGISAHITRSSGKIRTVYDRAEVFEVSDGGVEGQVNGAYIIEKVSALWNGDYYVDNGVERQLISTFFRKLIDKIAEITASPRASIHFYVWSKDEMKALVEACSRVDTTLLSHLNQLLGCRESLEQLIYSCLKDEIDNRFGLGWTGRGLSVVTSLWWFGQRFHWKRNISGSEEYLDRSFTQDIFDFKTDLEVNDRDEWARSQDTNTRWHKFEIRSRFHDQISVPYWYAYWGELPDPESENLDHQVRAAIIRYNEAIKPGHFDAFLKERLNALRWIEERVTFKNGDLEKPLLNISGLANFSLGINNVRQSALDFLRLDFHVRLSDWIASHILPPINRIVGGTTIPIRNLQALANRTVRSEIYVGNSNVTISQIKNNSSFSIGSFVRISPCNEDLNVGQTVRQLLNAGITATIESIDWDTGVIIFKPIPSNATSDYILRSVALSANSTYPFATIDESVTDFVSNRVERRLLMPAGAHVNSWLDPVAPTIPVALTVDPALLLRYELLLRDFEISAGRTLKEDQRSSIIDGLKTRIHLLLGPPGTGKTMTTSIAILTRVIHSIPVESVIVVAANTHMAVNNLLNRICTTLTSFTAFASAQAFPVPTIRIAKIDSDGDPELDRSIQNVRASAPVTDLRTLKNSAVAILGGTTSSILKLSENHGTTPFTTPFLVIDEASMMVLPHFLSLATLLTPDGHILLAGDNRQLSPITAHDWEREDRPPVVKYQPFLSAYDAIGGLRKADRITDSQITLSSLKYTFRLPPDIRDLISRLYAEDNVVLTGHDDRDSLNFSEVENVFGKVWQVTSGIFLITHDERDSRKSNSLEATIVKGIIEANDDLEDDSIAIITPHRAQRTLLTNELESYRNAATIIDTVERLQGGERPNVIVSATASDPSAIGANAEFILNLNRANVAFSRAQNRLIVVCSEELINYIPSDIEFYNSSLLWKTLRRLCSREIGTSRIGEYGIRILTIDRTLIDA